MKKIMLFLQIVIVFSAHISIDEGRLVAENIFAERSGVAKSTLSVDFVMAKQSGDLDLYYVYNINSDGFVIVAATDRVIPVLGYNVEHPYRNENRAPQFDAMLNNFVAQIEYAIENQIESDSNIRSRWEKYLAADFIPQQRDLRNVSPLLATNWDQDNPWNYACPTDAWGPGGHVYAGCVAVSMAQVMKYWEYPQTGEGSNSYNSDYGNLSVNFGNTTYNWSSMYNNSSSSATQTLLYHCGVGVEMQYSPDGSGAWVGGSAPSALHALENYFRYHSDANFKEKDNYSESTWESMLCDELDSGRPLVYRGYGNDGGHAFNIDGYQGTDYFHFNWGWSGYYNGYYYVSNLNPGGMSFTSSQGGIFNLHPESTSVPAISVSISQINTTLEVGQTGSGSFLISNTGDAGSTLTYSISESPSVAWISASPTSGSISSGNSNIISYSIGYSGLSDGSYSTDLVISNNAGNSVTIPVSLTVSAAANPIEFSLDCSGNYTINTTGNELQVFMANEMSVGGFQFDITDLPGGFMEFTGVETTERTNAFSISSSYVGNDFRVICFSMTGDVISSGSGAIATLIFDTADQLGNVEVCLTETVVSDEMGDPLQFTEGCCTMTIEQGGMKGDINNDGIINILDVVQTVNFVLGIITPDDYQFWAADYNSDGIINILDVVQIVNAVLTG